MLRIKITINNQQINVRNIFYDITDETMTQPVSSISIFVCRNLIFIDEPRTHTLSHSNTHILSHPGHSVQPSKQNEKPVFANDGVLNPDTVVSWLRTTVSCWIWTFLETRLTSSRFSSRPSSLLHVVIVIILLHFLFHDRSESTHAMPNRSRFSLLFLYVEK